MMWVYLLVYVVSGTGTNLSLRLLLNKMHEFQFFLVQTACFIYILFTGSFLLKDACRKRLRSRVILNRELNKRFLLMGFLDCVANYLVIAGAAHTNLAFQTLIPQGVIPVSLLLGSLILGSRFTKWQVGGALLIFFGIFFSIFLNNSDFWPAILFLSNFPLALSALVKELVLFHKSRELPVSYLNAFVSCLQLLIGFILAPFAGVAPGLLSSQFRDGYHCLLGEPTILSHHPECGSGSWVHLACFCALLFSMNISSIFLVRHANSSIMYAASALVLPLSNLANMFPVFMGESAVALDISSLFGLFSVLIGIFVFANSPQVRQPQPPVVYPQADVSLGKGLVSPGEKYYPIEKKILSSDMSLFDLATLIPPRGLVGGLGIAPWMPIVQENSLLARWSTTGQSRRSYQGQQGIWIPSDPPPGHVGKNAEKGGGFFEWGMQVEDIIAQKT